MLNKKILKTLIIAATFFLIITAIPIKPAKAGSWQNYPSQIHGDVIKKVLDGFSSDFANDNMDNRRRRRGNICIMAAENLTSSIGFDAATMLSIQPWGGIVKDILKRIIVLPQGIMKVVTDEAKKQVKKLIWDSIKNQFQASTEVVTYYSSEKCESTLTSTLNTENQTLTITISGNCKCKKVPVVIGGRAIEIKLQDFTTTITVDLGTKIHWDNQGNIDNLEFIPQNYKVQTQANCACGKIPKTPPLPPKECPAGTFTDSSCNKTCSANQDCVSDEKGCYSCRELCPKDQSYNDCGPCWRKDLLCIEKGKAADGKGTCFACQEKGCDKDEFDNELSCKKACANGECIATKTVTAVSISGKKDFKCLKCEEKCPKEQYYKDPACKNQCSVINEICKMTSTDCYECQEDKCNPPKEYTSSQCNNECFRGECKIIPRDGRKALCYYCTEECLENEYYKDPNCANKCVKTTANYEDCLGGSQKDCYVCKKQTITIPRGEEQPPSAKCYLLENGNCVDKYGQGTPKCFSETATGKYECYNDICRRVKKEDCAQDQICEDNTCIAKEETKCPANSWQEMGTCQKYCDLTHNKCSYNSETKCWWCQSVCADPTYTTQDACYAKCDRTQYYCGKNEKDCYYCIKRQCGANETVNSNCDNKCSAEQCKYNPETYCYYCEEVTPTGCPEGQFDCPFCQYTCPQEQCKLDPQTGCHYCE